MLRKQASKGDLEQAWAEWISRLGQAWLTVWVSSITVYFFGASSITAPLHIFVTLGHVLFTSLFLVKVFFNKVVRPLK